MDVARYIGLFLLKNNFVYLHGLGNLELRKKPAAYNGSALVGPSFQVVLTPAGSIDDNLANFIATNEQISISKAANALREFSIQARAELQAGRPVPIPSLGNFIEEKGKISFISDANLQHTPTPIASKKLVSQQEEVHYPTNADIPLVKPRYIDPEMEEESSKLSWGKITLWVIVLLAIAAGIYFGAGYLNKKDLVEEQGLAQAPVMEMVPDSITGQNNAESAAITDSLKENPDNLLSFNIILNTYTDRNKAGRRAERLTSYGHQVQLVVMDQDSLIYYVILPFEKISPADTSHLLDSIKRVFQPKSGIQYFNP
jgi:hypothetical protein